MLPLARPLIGDVLECVVQKFSMICEDISREATQHGLNFTRGPFGSPRSLVLSGLVLRSLQLRSLCFRSLCFGSLCFGSLCLWGLVLGRLLRRRGAASRGRCRRAWRGHLDAIRRDLGHRTVVVYLYDNGL